MIQRFSEQEEPISLVDIYQLAFLGKVRKNAFPCYTFHPSLFACGVVSYEVLDDIRRLEKQNRVKLRNTISNYPWHFEMHRKIMTEKNGKKEEITYRKDVHEGISAKDIGDLVKRREGEFRFPEKVRKVHPIFMETFATYLEQTMTPLAIGVYPTESTEKIKSETSLSLKKILRFLSRKDPSDNSQNCFGLVDELHRNIQPDKEYKIFTRKLQDLFDQIPEEKKPEMITIEEYEEHEMKKQLRLFGRI
ncbi:MAG: hypothetical protein GTN36_02885 [Candidatus Aenigmarchaeota archaeon]|nr:hypothetical protein [Candidatus Aenigmarchaeota archaeon]